MFSKLSDEPPIWAFLAYITRYLGIFIKRVFFRLKFYVLTTISFCGGLHSFLVSQWVTFKRYMVRLLTFRGGFFYKTPRLGLAAVMSTTVFSMVAVPVATPLSQQSTVDSILTVPDDGEVLAIQNTDRSAQTEQGKAVRTEVTTYVVAGGDTLGTIAEEHLVSIEALKYVNDLNSDIIRPGDELEIPPVDGLVHKVDSGETVSTIASKYNVSPQAIVDFNFIEEPYVIHQDQQLVIPNAEIPEPEPVVPAPQPVAPQPQQSTGLALEQIAPAPSGKMTMPTAGRLSQGFWSGHTAVDLAASCGTPIVAAESGTITFAGWWAYGGGNSIFIDHGNGYVTKYAHMSGFAKTGGYVQKGEVIGYVGDTGRAFGCHVHFIVNQNGRPINPMSVL